MNRTVLHSKDKVTTQVLVQRVATTMFNQRSQWSGCGGVGGAWGVGGFFISFPAFSQLLCMKSLYTLVKCILGKEKKSSK